jgi:hypothetical protein
MSGFTHEINTSGSICFLMNSKALINYLGDLVMAITANVTFLP